MNGRKAILWSLCAGLAAGCEPEVLPAAPAAVEMTGVRVQGTAEGAPWTWQAAAATTDGRTLQATDMTAGAGGAPPIDVHAKTTDWDLQARVARLAGDVRATRGDVTLTCDRIEVHYGPDDRIERLAADGHIRVRQGERSASAEHAEVVGKTGMIVLTGSPVLAEGQSRLEGTTITLFLDDQRVNCTSEEGGTCHLSIAGAALPSAGRP